MNQQSWFRHYKTRLFEKQPRGRQRGKLIEGKPSAKAQRAGFRSSPMSDEIELASDAEQNQNNPDNSNGMDHF